MEGGFQCTHRKRNRKRSNDPFKAEQGSLNKMELTRLQGTLIFEACMSEIAALENSTESFAMIAALTSGISGCAFMAGSLFAVTAAKPIIWLMILLAIPGFFLWGIAYSSL